MRAFAFGAALLVGCYRPAPQAGGPCSSGRAVASARNDSCAVVQKASPTISKVLERASFARTEEVVAALQKIVGE